MKAQPVRRSGWWSREREECVHEVSSCWFEGQESCCCSMNACRRAWHSCVAPAPDRQGFCFLTGPDWPAPPHFTRAVVAAWVLDHQSRPSGSASLLLTFVRIGLDFISSWNSQLRTKIRVCFSHVDKGRCSSKGRPTCLHSPLGPPTTPLCRNWVGT